WVNDCERLLALEKRLPEISRGTGSLAEQLSAAEMLLRYKQRYADAALLYGKAFAAEPKLAADPKKGNRYKAACAAALAASGRGLPPAKLAATDKARLRGQAFDWLQAELKAWARLLAAKPASARAIRQGLQPWLDAAALSGVRGAKDLAELPRAERERW